MISHHQLSSMPGLVVAHCVEVGDRVEKGDVVGAIGSTGQSTGPHLHWGMQVGEVEIDPALEPQPPPAELQLAKISGGARFEFQRRRPLRT